MEKEEATGRFGHHPDPAIDFCAEVDAIEGLVADWKADLEEQEVVEDRLFKARQFRVGGDIQAIKAKWRLREVDGEFQVARGEP